MIDPENQDPFEFDGEHIGRWALGRFIVPAWHGGFVLLEIVAQLMFHQAPD